ncbi:GGDEF domain-containing protein [Methyloraptor flagellatus]|jgi:diguanylate cyclase|uniref:diguanylate cyclase n=1 Tax=Methyloraptor flagellatus TaxID=3162530 RepID=A0AAU7XEF6_9HYPH
MSERDDFRRTLAYGETAIGHLRKNEIPAYPRNYELWYTYAAGFNHALNKTVNEILRTRGKISVAEVSKVYDQFIAPTRLGERIEEVGGKLSTEIADVVGMIESSLTATSDYCVSLDEATRRLSGTTDRESVSGIVQSLIKVTKDTETTNRKLEHQLADSRRQIAELQESLEAIRYESLTDELTTLANRKHFDQSMERAIAECEQSNQPFALLLTDIDHFKKFNDTYGHQTGDQVLRLVALAVKQNVKGQDVACRYGGEEFAVILPRTNLRQAVVVAEHIREAVYSKELVKRSTGENLGRITISIGVASWRRGDNSQTLIERSDCSLYAAKRGGRNLVRCETDTDVNLDTRVA